MEREGRKVNVKREEDRYTYRRKREELKRKEAT